MSGVRVAAMRASDGKGTIVAVTQTGPDGRYVLDRIPPGQYYILAGSAESPSYYPGVTQRTAARAVAVARNARLKRLDFKVRRTAVTVSGRVVSDSFDSQFATVKMTNARGESREVSAVSGGAFKFENVAPGPYKIEGPPKLGLEPVSIVVNEDDLTDLRLAAKSAVGYRVTGRLIGISSRPIDFQTQNIALFSRTAGKLPRRAEIQSDGRFEFHDVSPGVYAVTAASNTAMLVSDVDVEVRDRDINSLEIPLAAMIPARVHVSMENGTPLPTSPIRFRARIGGTSQSGSIGKEGASQIFLVDGRNYVFFYPPAGYFMKSVTAGNVDLLNQGLELNPPTSDVDIEVAVGTTPSRQTRMVSVRGHITGGYGGMMVRLVDPILPGGGKFVEARTDNAGMFEFKDVGPGSYDLDVPPALSVRKDILVLGHDVAEVDANLPTGIIIAGRMMTPVDTTGRPIGGEMPQGIGLRLTSATTSKLYALGPAAFVDGLPEDTYRVSIEALPEGYLVRAVNSGGIDLLHSPLRLRKRSTPGEIQVVLQSNGRRIN